MIDMSASARRVFVSVQGGCLADPTEPGACENDAFQYRISGCQASLHHLFSLPSSSLC